MDGISRRESNVPFPPPPASRFGWPWLNASQPAPPAWDIGTTWPKVTVVTPSYNQARFLEETIRSVLLQGYPNLEYIVIDGGSDDGSVEIIREYEPWLAYWESERDRGQSHAINKGFGRATGDVVAWLNSDDIYQPGAIVAAVAALQRNPEAAFVHSDYDVIDAASCFVRRVTVGPRTTRELLTGDGIGQPTVFMRRAALDRVGPLREDLHMVMDLELWFRLTRALPSVYVPDACFAAFREYPTSKTIGAGERQTPELLRVLDDLYREPALDASIRSARRRAYARVFMRAAMLQVDRGRAFPNGLYWYLKAVASHPGLLLSEPLAAPRIARRSLRQMTSPMRSDRVT